jgi:uncharacterized protein
MKTLFFTLLLVYCQVATAVELPDFPFIYATGSASKDIPPNTAKLDFKVEAFDESPDKSYNLVHSRSKEILSLINKLGIPIKNVESYKIFKETVHQEKDYEELKILGYKVNQHFSIRINQLSQYTSLLNELLKLTNVSEFNSEFDVVERKKIESDLMTQAVADAKGQADRMAAASGNEVDSAYAVSEHAYFEIDNEFGINTNPFLDAMFKKSMMGGNENTTHIPSTIKLGKSANVIFKLKD